MIGSLLPVSAALALLTQVHKDLCDEQAADAHESWRFQAHALMLLHAGTQAGTCAMNMGPMHEIYHFKRVC